MTPHARIAAAISILDDLCARTTPVDRALSSWARSNRYAGSKDRRAISEHVYQAIRQAFRAAAIMGAEQPDNGRMLMLGSLKLQGMTADELTTLFTGEKYAPSPLTESELLALSGSDVPDQLKGLPAPFATALSARVPGHEVEALIALTDRAPLDLRLNTLLSPADNILETLAEEGLSGAPVAHVPTACRMADNIRIVDTAVYKGGLVEIQDAGSQVAAGLVPVMPGDTVVDYCAGGGGKALALAALMPDGGTILAHDVASNRLESLTRRARRAKAGNITVCKSRNDLIMLLNRLGGEADHVVLDVPCSGSGALRRNPETLWRFDEPRFNELRRLQAQILREAAPLVKVGGTVTYITCSILLEENERVVERFLAENTGFELEPIETHWPSGQLDGTVQLMPHLTETDGFFIARLRRAC